MGCERRKESARRDTGGGGRGGEEGKEGEREKLMLGGTRKKLGEVPGATLEVIA